MFTSGVGYNTYRIPAIVRATNGTLLAFCEGRPSSADTGNIDIVMKRSTDNGVTWGALTVLRDEGTGEATNPSPLVDETTGRIYLHYSVAITRPFYIYSDDNGFTWSAPVEITATAKASGWGLDLPGPGHGIQLKRGAQAGRLVVPCHHYLTSGVKGIHTVYSDDHGVTWHYGAVADTANNINPDENLAVELVSPATGGGSRMYYNIRDEGGSAAGNRTVGWSTNGGTTLNLPLTNDIRFVCPTVQGSVVRMCATDQGDPYNVILFSCPNNSSRTNMSVWYSTDEGLNWSAPRSVYSGGAAYSDLVLLADGTVGLFYEKDPTSVIVFTNIGPGFLGLATTNTATWNSTSSIGWGTASCWVGGAVPSWGNTLDINFYNSATTKYANNIGSSGVTNVNRIIRSLNFNDNADNDVSIQLQSANTASTITFDADFGSANLTVSSGSAGSHLIGNGWGSIILADNLLVTHNGSGTLTIDRPITETGDAKSLTKSGSGMLILSGTNTYTGPTTVSNGTLVVSGSLSNTTVTVNSGATLGGTGIIRGAVSVQGGGTLSPGASIGTFTISNNLVLAGTTFVEVNAGNGQRDFVQGVTNITYGGSLVVTNLSGTLTNGQTFQLFSATGTKVGNFTSITPALTGGQSWSFNPTNGVLSVVSTTATYPTNVTVAVSGGVLSLTWPGTHLGWIAQSNIVGLGSPSNWFDILGSSGLTNLNIVPNPAQSNVFYRLRSP